MCRFVSICLLVCWWRGGGGLRRGWWGGRRWRGGRLGGGDEEGGDQGCNGLFVEEVGGEAVGQVVGGMRMR